MINKLCIGRSSFPFREYTLRLAMPCFISTYLTYPNILTCTDYIWYITYRLNDTTVLLRVAVSLVEGVAIVSKVAPPFFVRLTYLERAGASPYT